MKPCRARALIRRGAWPCTDSASESVGASRSCAPCFKLRLAGGMGQSQNRRRTWGWPLRTRLDWRGPADSLWLGEMPSHEARWSARLEAVGDHDCPPLRQGQVSLCARPAPTRPHSFFHIPLGRERCPRSRANGAGHRTTTHADQPTTRACWILCCSTWMCFQEVVRCTRSDLQCTASAPEPYLSR